MTGAQLCRRLLEEMGSEAEVRRGAVNQYHPARRIIELRGDCFRGRSVAALTLAAHEVGHAEQGQCLAWAMGVRWTLPGRLFLEWDASQRARRMLRAHGVAVCEATLRESWRSYLLPALGQVGVMMMGVELVANWRR